MNRWLAVLVASAVAVLAAHGQRAPRIGYVYPAGGRQGETFEVTVGGQFLVGTNEAYFTGSGIKAAVIGYERPMSGSETELMRDRLRQLEEQRKQSAGSKGANPEADKEIAEMKEKLAKFGNGPMFNVAIAENVKLRVTMARDAALGDQEIRLATPGGLSNPLVFCVGQLPEYSEPAARGSLKAEIDAKPRGKRRFETAADVAAKEESPLVTLPAVINGQILPGQEDRIRFSARRGQRVVFAVSARKLIPYLPDAVPGWFQATLAIYDAKGRELAYVDDFRFNPDPVLCYEFPKDGEYEMAIHDSIYRGREDFVYRITAGELPFITSIFPLGGSAGGQANVELRGWNLPAASLALDLKTARPGLLPLVAAKGQTVSNFMPFAVDSLPEIFEKEPNNAPAAAQVISVPTIINGRIDRPGDLDVYSIKGKAGETIVAEIYARRLNSPLDSILRLTDAGGKEVAVNDDCEDKGAGLTTHHADSRLSVKLPADGIYFLRVADTQHGGGAEYAYRLRVSEPQPDFALRVVPSSLSGRCGATVPITVYALRRDGFAGEINLSLQNASPGLKLSGTKIPAGQDLAKLSVTLPAPSAEPVALAMEGEAPIGGQIVAHAAVPADDREQAFAYHHLVPAKECRIAIAGRLAATGQMKLATAAPVKIPAGGVTRVQFAGRIDDPEKVRLELSDPPAGIGVKSVKASADGAEIEFTSDAATVVGQKGSLTLQAFSAASEGGPKPVIPLGALPAISFEVVAP